MLPCNLSLSAAGELPRPYRVRTRRAMLRDYLTLRETMRPAAILILCVCACLVPLVLGVESILLIALPGGLPLGTLLAAVALIAGSAIPLAQSREYSWLRRAGSIVFVAAIVWLPLGILLSGNPSLSFMQDASDSAFFWRFTAVLVVLILVSISWAGMEALLQRCDQRTGA